MLKAAEPHGAASLSQIVRDAWTVTILAICPDMERLHPCARQAQCLRSRLGSGAKRSCNHGRIRKSHAETSTRRNDALGACRSCIMPDRRFQARGWRRHSTGRQQYRALQSDTGVGFGEGRLSRCSACRPAEPAGRQRISRRRSPRRQYAGLRCCHVDVARNHRQAGSHRGGGKDARPPAGLPDHHHGAGRGVRDDPARSRRPCCADDRVPDKRRGQSAECLCLRIQPGRQSHRKRVLRHGGGGDACRDPRNQPGRKA